MTPNDQSNESLELLLPLVDRGYRVALLWTGSAAAAEGAVESAMSSLLRLPAVERARSDVALAFFATLLHRLGEGPRAAAVPVERRTGTPRALQTTARRLRRLGLLCRIAVILDLAGELSPDETARLLHLPVPTVLAARHLGTEQLHDGLDLPAREESFPAR